MIVNIGYHDIFLALIKPNIEVSILKEKIQSNDYSEKYSKKLIKVFFQKRYIRRYSQRNRTTVQFTLIFFFVGLKFIPIYITIATLFCLFPIFF